MCCHYETSNSCNSNIIEVLRKLLEDSGFKFECNTSKGDWVGTTKFSLTVYWDKNIKGIAAEMYQKGIKKINDKNIDDFSLIVNLDENITGVGSKICQGQIDRINDENIQIFEQILDEINTTSQNGEYSLCYYYIHRGVCYNPKAVKKMIFDSGFDIYEVDDDFENNYFQIDWKYPR